MLHRSVYHPSCLYTKRPFITQKNGVVEALRNLTRNLCLNIWILPLFYIILYYYLYWIFILYEIYLLHNAVLCLHCEANDRINCIFIEAQTSTIETKFILVRFLFRIHFRVFEICFRFRVFEIWLKNNEINLLLFFVHLHEWIVLCLAMLYVQTNEI